MGVYQTGDDCQSCGLPASECGHVRPETPDEGSPPRTGEYLPYFRDQKTGGKMEHSERARYVTEQVSLWIQNDGDCYGHAQDLLATPDVLGSWLRLVLKTSVEGSAPWYVAQELAPNDYDRIDWETIAKDLTEE